MKMANLLARRVAQGFGLQGLVGNGRDNAPDDVLAVMRQLARHGRYTLPDDGSSEFIDRAMLDGIAAFQRERGLKIDGWLAPGGETERNLALPPGRIATAPTPYFPLRGEVGNGRANNEDDVIGLKRTLGALGLYRHDRTADPSPFIDTGMLDGIKTFQRDHGLKVDGWLRPGGETATALQNLLPRRGEPLNLRNLPYDPAEPAYVRTMEIRPDEPPAKPVLLADSVSVMSDAWGQSLLVDDEPDTDKPVQVAMAPVLAAPALGAAAVRIAPIIAKEAAKRLAPLFRPAATTLGKQAIDNNDVVGRYITDLFNETRPMESSRGDEDTVAGNDQGLRECIKQLNENYPEWADKIKHVGGATQDGLGRDKLKELYLPDAVAKAEGRDGRKGSSNVDWSFQDITKDKEEAGAFLHVNTQSTKSDGVTPTGREARQFDNTMRNAIKDTVYNMPKRTKDISEEEYQKIVEEHCAKMWTKHLGAPKGQGAEEPAKDGE